MKRTPEGEAVASEMKRQEGQYWKARLWDHDAIAAAAIAASEEVKELKRKVKALIEASLNDAFKD